MIGRDQFKKITKNVLFIEKRNTSQGCRYSIGNNTQMYSESWGK